MKPFLRQFDTKNQNLKSLYALHAEDLQQQNNLKRSLELMLLLGVEARLLNQLNDACEYLKAALDLARQQHDIQAELNACLQLGICEQYLEHTETADDYFQKALKMTLENDLTHRRHDVLMAWGKLLAEQGKYDVAQNCFEQVLNLRQDLSPEGQWQAEIEEAEDALELLDALDLVDDKGYAVSYTEITHIETPDFDTDQPDPSS